MSDITDKLRAIYPKYHNLNEWDVRYEAADTIEALRAENVRLQQLNCEIIRKDELEIIEALRAENARLRNLLDNALGWLDDKEHDKPLLSVDSIRAARAAMGETD